MAKAKKAPSKPKASPRAPKVKLPKVPINVPVKPRVPRGLPMNPGMPSGNQPGMPPQGGF